VTTPELAQPVDFRTEGRVAIITLNRPDARNAVNGAVTSAMDKALCEFEENEDLWVAVLTATGPVFCAGADLKAVASGDTASISPPGIGFAALVERERTKPIIAAVDGAAVGGGCEIALACDLIVASTSAVFGLPEVKRSLLAAAGGLVRLPVALPRNLAMEAILTGDPLSAQVCHQHGMVNVLAAPGEVLPAALALAERINANAPLAVRAARRVALVASTGAEAAGWEATRTEMRGVARTDDYQEGPRAFAEKRAPAWTGR
jgi:enoyl-CoA hydratase